MKILKVKEFEFILDSDIFEQYQGFSFSVNVSRGKPHLQIYIDGAYSSMSRLIMNSGKRTIFLNKNVLDLRRENLAHSSPERQRQSAQRFYQKNKERLNKKQLELYYADKEKFTRRGKEFRQRNKEKYQKRRQTPHVKALLYKQNRNINSKYRFLKYQAKARHITFNITKIEYSELVLDKFCHYCTKSVMLEAGGSLDRINNDLGYSCDNVLVCCRDCNQLRGDRLTVKETEIAINAILEYRKNNIDFVLK